MKLELISIERPDEIDEHHIGGVYCLGFIISVLIVKALMKIISIAQFNEDVFRT